MTINEIISKHYSSFYAMLKNKKIPIYNSLTAEDVLQNVMITAINKFGDKQIKEEEGFEYIKKSLKTELHFSFKRKANERLIYTDNLTIYDKETE